MTNRDGLLRGGDLKQSPPLILLGNGSHCLGAQDHPPIPEAASRSTRPACTPALHRSALLVYHQVGGRAWPLGKGFSAAGPLCQSMGVAGMCGLPWHLEDKSILWARSGLGGGDVIKCQKSIPAHPLLSLECSHSSLLEAHILFVLPRAVGSSAVCLAFPPAAGRLGVGDVP